MFRFVLHRALLAALTLFLITLVVYGLISAMPGDPAGAAIGDDPSLRISPEDWQRIERLYGLDRPWHTRYFIWIGNVLRGDFGTSLAHHEPVARVVARRIGPTLLLSIASLLLVYGLSIPLGLYLAHREGAADTRATSVALYALYSLPVFVAALFLQLLLAVKLDWLPLLGMTSENYAELTVAGKAWDLFRHALLPVACYTYGSLAYISRFVHANLREQTRQDYMRTALAKGLSPWQALWRHAFRNTLIPLVTLLGLTLPTLLSGSVIVEQIFAWPGLGRLFFDSIRTHDDQVIMALVLLYSVLTLVGQMLADVLYAWVDPRIGRK